MSSQPDSQPMAEVLPEVTEGPVPNGTSIQASSLSIRGVHSMGFNHETPSLLPNMFMAIAPLQSGLENPELHLELPGCLNDLAY